MGLVVAGVLCAAALVLASARTGRPRPQWLRRASGLGLQWVGRPAPRIDLPTLGGGSLRSEALEGTVTLVHFWATWCPSCLPELPHYRDLARRLGPRGLRVVHVSLDEEWGPVRAVLREAPYEHVLLDPEGALAHRFGTEKLPETYLMDRRGRVLLRMVATQPWEGPELRALVEDALLK